MNEQNEKSIILMEYNRNIDAKEEGSKYRLPTANEFIEELKNAYNGHSPLTSFIDEHDEIWDQYQTFAAYFRKVNGNIIDAPIYISVHINFDLDDMSKFSLSITHSSLKGLKPVHMTYGNLKTEKE